MKVFKWIKDIINYRSLRKELLREYQTDDLVNRFTDIYKVPFKVDEAGRLYAVINPFLLNIKENNASQIYEYTSNGMTDTTYIKQWVMSNLMAIEKLFAAENLLDVLTFDIKQIYANEQPSGNYLIVFSPYGFDDYVNAKQNLLILLSSLIGIGLLIFAGIKIFI